MIYGPASSARITIQAAEQIRQFGVLAPFSATSPLAPLLVAVVASTTGISEEWAYLAVVLAVYCGGCAAVFFFAKSLYRDRTLAAGSALLFAAVPSRVNFALGEPDAPRLLFWSLAPLLAAAVIGFLRRRTPTRLAWLLCVAGVSLATLSLPWSSLDLLALAELCAVSIFAALIPRRHFFPALGACSAALLLPSVWVWGIYPRLVYQPTKMPEEAVVWARKHSTGGRIFGPASLEVLSNPYWRRADRIIREPGRAGESLMWLQAMGTEYLISRDWPKFHSLLECNYQADEWCVYRLPAPSHAGALFVSRRQWENLKPIRGLYDVEGLEAYMRWAQRPELAGVHWNAATAAQIRADLGPFDVIYVKVPFRPGWRAWVESESGSERPIEVCKDPLGFVVVDPGETGPVVVRLAFSPGWRERLLPEQEKASFIEGDFPIISRDGIAAGTDYSPPPFPPGTILTIFGRNFVPEDTRVLFDGKSGEVTYASDQQINVRLPQDLPAGPVEVVVESEGRRSYPRIVEVAR